MESFRTLFFPRYPEKKADRTKTPCESANNAGSNFDRYKIGSAAQDAPRRQNAMTSDQSS